jgi:hypothetical protein
MERRERNTIVGVISIIIGLIFILYLIPTISLLFFSPYSPFNISAFFTSSTGYLFMYLFVFVITIFLFGFFLIRPTKTTRGRSNLAIGALVFGGILVVLPVIGMGFSMFYSAVLLGGYSIYYIALVTQSLVLLIPGVIILIHGSFLRKKSRTEDTEGF